MAAASPRGGGRNRCQASRAEEAAKEKRFRGYAKQGQQGRRHHGEMSSIPSARRGRQRRGLRAHAAQSSGGQCGALWRLPAQRARLRPTPGACWDACRPSSAPAGVTPPSTDAPTQPNYWSHKRSVVSLVLIDVRR